MNSEIVCVLGMHRSGTSLVAGVLNLLGVYLGPEEHLMEPGAANPKGFWEHQAIVAIDDQILARFGGSWHEPPDFSVGWASGPDLEDLRQGARALLRGEFGAAPVWGWKDPRTCLTLPFWQELLPNMKYVICLRHPASVARSLERRDGFSMEKGIYLWLTYLKSALEHSAGQQRTFLSYERFMTDWPQEIGRLAQLVGTPERVEQPDVQDAIRNFVDEDLQHHPIARIEATDGADGADLGLGAAALRQADHIYRQLGGGDGGFQQSDVMHMLDEGTEALGPEVSRQAREAYERWLAHVQAQVELAAREIEVLVPVGDAFILVDEAQLPAGDHVHGRRAIPFPEQEGCYWGPPPDAAAAIQELERLRRCGARFIAFAWPAFWWLKHYEGLHTHLRSNYARVVENERLVVFDLRKERQL